MKICFLSLGSYPILTMKNLGVAGGAEVQQVHLARELAAQGFDISFVTFRHGRNQVENINGIKIIKTYEREKAGEMSDLLKYISIWASLKKANADVYFHTSGSPGILPLFCYMNRKKFVYRIATDAKVLGKPLFGKYSYKSKIIDRLEIMRADIVIAQSEFQRRILRERFKVESDVIKNGLPIPKVDCEKPNSMILWVGSISSVKCPHLFIELAKCIPKAHFEMVGGRTRDRQLYENIKHVARKLPNLTFHGFVPHPKLYEYFERASVFVNTSSIEGFPNTFIEAWAHYTPVVSLNVDPDGIIKNQNLGFRPGTFKQLISDVGTLLDNQELRKKMGKNGRTYIEKEHDIRKMAKEYIRVFENVCCGKTLG